MRRVRAGSKVFGVRASTAELERWRAVSAGNLNAWIRASLNAAADVAERLAEEERGAAEERERLQAVVFPLEVKCSRSVPQGFVCGSCGRQH